VSFTDSDDFTLLEFKDGTIGLGLTIPFGFVLIGGWLSRESFDRFRQMVDAFSDPVRGIPKNWVDWDADCRPGDFD